MKKKFTSAEEFDEYFDNGGDITPYIDKSTLSRPNFEANLANVDFSISMIAALDKEAARLGVTRQELVKMWIAQKLKDVA